MSPSAHATGIWVLCFRKIGSPSSQKEGQTLNLRDKGQTLNIKKEGQTLNVIERH